MRHPIHWYKVLLWDFDGVIKDSMRVKTAAFRQLFAEFGPEVQDRVQAHHEAHGGISRFEKIPYYFREYVGRDISSAETERWCERFSRLVLDAVIKSPWVPGAREYLRKNFKRQHFFIVTGTPQGEIHHILDELDLAQYFLGVFGAPESKKAIIARIIEANAYAHSECLMVGDSLTDYHAARENDVDFLLRETEENRKLFLEATCAKLKDFSGLLPSGE